MIGSIQILAADQPWAEGEFTASELFDEVETLFAAELDLLEAGLESAPAFDAWETSYRAIFDAGLRLHRADGSKVPEFLLHIDGHRAWFRWSDEPFDVGGIGDPI